MPKRLPGCRGKSLIFPAGWPKSGLTIASRCKKKILTFLPAGVTVCGGVMAWAVAEWAGVMAWTKATAKAVATERAEDLEARAVTEWAATEWAVAEWAAGSRAKEAVPGIKVKKFGGGHVAPPYCVS